MDQVKLHLRNFENAVKTLRLIITNHLVTHLFLEQHKPRAGHPRINAQVQVAQLQMCYKTTILTI